MSVTGVRQGPKPWALLILLATVCSSIPRHANADTQSPGLVPLYGSLPGDVSAEGLGPVSVVARLAPGVTVQQVNEYCKELGGSLSQASTPRFSGTCILDLPDEARLQESTDPATPVAWPFLTIRFNSSANLNAVRVELAGPVAYFEYDGVVTITAPTHGRRLHTVDLRKYLPGTETKAAAYCSRLPWGLDRIDERALPTDGRYTPTSGLDGRGTHIYVVDTGLRYSHRDFVGRVGQGVSCVLTLGPSTCSPATLPVDGNGHGTHVTGTAAGACHGVAKGATVHSVRALDEAGRGSFSAILAGLRWVVQHTQANKWRGVVNLSLGSEYSRSVNDAVAQVVAANIPVVVAAGNEGTDACKSSPASAPGAITVGSTDANDRASSFSNTGSCLDVWAPGRGILSAWFRGDDAETTLSGTSMASPHVTGVVALILQGNPTASPDEVDKILAQASVDIWFNSASTIQPTSSTTNFLQAINLPKACTDTPPDSRYTCAQQVGWGKCGVAFMQDKCNRSCGRC